MNRSPRLWPAYAIVGTAVAVIGVSWLGLDAIRQVRMVATIAVGVVATLLLWMWFAFFSRMPPRLRIRGSLVAAALVSMAATLFRIRGVTGDLVPIVEPRWASRAQPEPPAAPEPSNARAMPTSAASPVQPDAPAQIGAPAPAGADTRQAPAATTLAASDSPAVERRVARADYPQFLGPNRNGRVTGIRLARDWTSRAPRPLWRRRVGTGWASFAVRGEIAVTQEQFGEEEHVVAYDLLSGRVLWRHVDRARFDETLGGEGPRATPALVDEAAYTLGATGILNALDLASGRLLWTKDVVRDNGAQLPEWGKSSSPLVHGDAVVVSAGGGDGRSLVAYDRKTGVRVWAGGDSRSAYASPALLELAGQLQIVMLNAKTVTAHDPETGSVLWEHPWPAGQPNVAQPLALGDDLLMCSAGYGVGSKAYRVGRDASGNLAATLLWESPRLKAKFANLVAKDGFVYGLDDGVLTCLDPADGSRRWKDGRFGHGQLILVEDLLLVQTEEGELVLVDPNPERLVELARFRALDGKTWNPPALAGTLLLVRNDREAACYELPLAQ